MSTPPAQSPAPDQIVGRAVKITSAGHPYSSRVALAETGEVLEWVQSATVHLSHETTDVELRLMYAPLDITATVGRVVFECPGCGHTCAHPPEA